MHLLNVRVFNLLTTMTTIKDNGFSSGFFVLAKRALLLLAISSVFQVSKFY